MEQSLNALSDPFILPASAILSENLKRRLNHFTFVDWVSSTQSTNTDLLNRARTHYESKPWLLGAHHQHNGRGRAGRAWHDKPHSTLMFSCAFDLDIAAFQLPALSPLAGLIAGEALHRLLCPAPVSNHYSAATDLRMKWPNDLQWRDAKLAGILVETLRNLKGPASSYSAIIGIGLNLDHAEQLSHEINRPITDWTRINRQNRAFLHSHVNASDNKYFPFPTHTIIDMICAIATAWHDTLEIFQQQGFSVFISRFNQIDALAQRDVHVLEQGKIKMSGRACGCDAQGRLLIQTPEGLTPILNGEISIQVQA